MAHIPLTHTTYRASKVATFLDSLCNFLIAFTLSMLIWAISTKQIDGIIIDIIALAFIVLFKMVIIPKIADKAFDKAKERMIAERGNLQLQHIIAIDLKGKHLIIKCPYCTNPVDITKTCSCGCDVWKRDFLFQDEIDKILKANNIEVDYGKS